MPVTAARVLVIAAVALGAFCAPAHALERVSPAMSITASPSTNVGLQVFANVNLSGGANPTGTIAFRLFGPGDTACASPIFTSNVAAGVSVNSARFTTGQAGTYRWEASYSGDASNSATGPTSCAAPSAAVIVSPDFTGLSLSAQAPAGGTIRATATIGGFHPTGTITFQLTPPGDQFCARAPVFTSTVPVSGTAVSSASYTPTATGSYKWRATYSGDTNNYRDGPTACLDANAAVTVSSLTAPPPAPTGPAPTSPPAAPGPTAPPATHPRVTAPPATTPATTATTVARPTPTTTGAVPPVPPAPGATSLGAGSPAAAPAGAAHLAGAALKAVRHEGTATSPLWWLASAVAALAAAGCGALLLWGRTRRAGAGQP